MAVSWQSLHVSVFTSCAAAIAGSSASMAASVIFDMAIDMFVALKQFTNDLLTAAKACHIGLSNFPIGVNLH